MATKTPISPQEQDEAYSRTQNLYEREFNPTTRNKLGSDMEQIDGYDRSADGLDAREEEFEDGGIGASKPVVINDNADDPKANITNVEDQETNPEPVPQSSGGQPQGGGGGFFGKLTGKVKNAGPGFTIGSTTLASLGVISTMMSPGVLLVQIKEVFHNDGADATRSSNLFSRAITSFKLGKADCSKPGIKCKMSTMSKEQAEKYRKAGFTIEGDGIDKNGKDTGEKAQDAGNTDSDKNANDTKSERFKVTAITFPDGKKISLSDANMGQKFHAYTKANINMRIAALKGFNPKSAVYQSKAFTKILSTFKLAKGKIIKGSTDEERKKQFDEHSGGQSEEDNHNKAKQDEEKKKVSDEVQAKSDELNKKGGFDAAGAVSVVQVSCGLYNFSRVAVATVKTIQIAKLIGFGFMFLQAADQIKDKGSIDPGTVSMLASMLTYYVPDKNSPKYNLSATDSQGYRIAAQGDKSGLKSFAKNYMVGGNGPVAGVSSTLSQIQHFVGTGNNKAGKQRIRDICKNANSAEVIAGSLIAGCLSGVTGDGIGVIVTLGICAAAQLGKQQAYNEAIQRFIMPNLLNAAVAFMDVMNIGSDLKGVDAGNALAVGAGLMLGTTATEYGLRPAKDTKETQSYVAYTNQFENDYNEAMAYEARDTPFDYTNQYSFLGSIVNSLNIQSAGSTPIFAGIANILNILPMSFATIGNASALYNQPSMVQDERFNCPDEDLINIDISNADKFCQIRAITPVATNELQNLEDQAQDKNNLISDVIDYMQKSQTADEDGGGTTDNTGGCDDDCKKQSQLPSIDDNGKPIDGSQYSKYIKYCTKRTLADQGGTPDYWGTSTQGVEEGSDKDQLWFTGEQCEKDSTMMQMFRQYTGICHASAEMDTVSDCWGDDTTTSTSSNCGDGTTASIYDCALQFDPYQYLWGGGHGASAEDYMNKFHNGDPAKGEPAVDCSGLVRMATWDAFHIDTGSIVAGDGYASNSHYQSIPVTSVQKGDIITFSEHVAIVESISGDTIKTFEAHGNAAQNGHGSDTSWDISSGSYSVSGSGITGAYRFVK